MSSLSIGIYMNQFNPKKKKVYIKSTISLGVRHPKEYKLKPFF